MKKFLALLLSVLMLLSVAPVAFAQDAQEEQTTVVAEDTNEEDADASLGAGDLFGGFFIKLGEMLQIIFNFLSNLFNGTGDTNIDFM